MGIMPYKEYDISKKISYGSEKYFAVSTEDIRGITIGGIDGNLRLVSYKMDDSESEVIILEILNDGERFYFKPIFSEDDILILSEDYYCGDSLELSLGEIRLSTNRQRQQFREYRNLFTNDDYSSVLDNKELVLENPLGVYLTSLEPLSLLPDDGKRIVNYNKMYADDLKHKIGRMKFDAQTEIIKSYDRVFGKKYSR